MKTFVVTFNTNYGLAVMIINAVNIENAKTIAEKAGAWHNSTIEELDLQKEGLIFEDMS